MLIDVALHFLISHLFNKKHIMWPVTKPVYRCLQYQVK